MDILPKDPVMLMSFVNMKLRDEYRTLEDFCAVYALKDYWIIHILELKY